LQIDWCGAGNPPSSVSASSIDSSHIQLTIGSQSSEDDALDSNLWKIYRSQTQDSGYVWVATIPSSSTSFTDSNLTAGIRYYYRITGVDSGISDTWTFEGNYSAEASAVPSLPVDVKIIADMGFNPSSVNITGSFNSWSLDKPLTKQADGRWSCTVTVQPYVNYDYKLIANGSVYEENAEYKLEYYDTTGTAANIYVSGLMNNWSTTTDRMRKIAGTDTWVAYLKGVNDGQTYKF